MSEETRISENLTKTRPILMVYIPCWVNFPQAINQAKALKHQYSSDKTLTHLFQLEIVCSINSVGAIPSEFRTEMQRSFDHLYEIEATTGDVNINLGFYTALQRKAQFLWILSPDDTVTASALSTITGFLIGDPNVDLLVANEEGHVDQIVNLTESNLDIQMMSVASFGLVTGVIYRLEKFQTSLHLGLQASFTHWGQLAVLLGALRQFDQLTSRILSANLTYVRGDSKVLDDLEFDRNVSNYSGSFFGYAVLLSLMKSNPGKELRKWVRVNFFHIGMYKQGYYSGGPRKIQDLTNLHLLARNHMRTAGLTHYLMFRCSENINFSRFRKLAYFGRKV